MQPKREPEQPQRELFQIDLEHLIDMSHPLVGLGHFNDWQSFEQTLGSTYHFSHGAPGISTRLGNVPNFRTKLQDSRCGTRYS